MFASAATKSSLLHALRSEIVVRDIAASRSDVEGVCGEMGKIGMPVLGDLKARRHPYLFMAHDVIEKADQGSRAPRPTDHAAMQTNRHHPRQRFAFGIQNVEAVLEIAEELVAVAEALRI